LVKEKIIMTNRRLLPLALVLLLVGTCLALPALAAEGAPPALKTVPSSCSASAAATVSLPAFLAPAPVLRDTDTCGCGDSACVGQAVGSRCISLEMGIHVCRVITGLCPTTGSKCECFLAP
jgi:hypothetical protein